MDLAPILLGIAVFGFFGAVTGAAPTISQLRLRFMTVLLVLCSLLGVLAHQTGVLTISLPWLLGLLLGMAWRYRRSRVVTK